MINNIKTIVYHQTLERNVFGVGESNPRIQLDRLELPLHRATVCIHSNPKNTSPNIVFSPLKRAQILIRYIQFSVCFDN
jgi:hypothetical protein